MYIKGLACISPQNTFESELFASDVSVHSGNQYHAIEPSYSDLIPNRLLRRMGKSTRMGIGTGMPLLKKWSTDGIIIGTTDGGMNDCHKFLNQIVDYDEGTLTPTSFVQGSPSSLAGVLALMSKNTGYNNTHSNKGLSFENCLTDAQLLLDEGIAKTLMLGNVEEISPGQFNIETLAGHIKGEDISSTKLLQSTTPGTVHGEGAAMFVVSSDKENAIAEILDFDTIVCPSQEDLKTLTQLLLSKNGLEIQDVDTFILGQNGDSETDSWYSYFQEEFLSDQGVLSFKNIFGESSSVTSMATWLAVQLLQESALPDMIVQKELVESTNCVLIYNQFLGEQHSLILLRKA